MPDCISSNPLSFSSIVQIPKLGLARNSSIPAKQHIRNLDARNCSRSLVFSSFDNFHLLGSGSPRFCQLPAKPIARASQLEYEDHDFYSEFDSQDEGERQLKFESSRRYASLGNVDMDSSLQNGKRYRKFRNDAMTADEEFDGIRLEDELKDEGRSVKSGGCLEEEDLVPVESYDSGDLRAEEAGQLNGRTELGVSRRRRQVMKRSNILAKQVISIQSALSLGFITQLWVDTTSWVVWLIEVRPSLLSGEADRFLLEDVSQVGDVVLIKDENVIMHKFKMVGLETLVGYKVVTLARQYIGKVRGYSFDINSGAVESLELDSFGISVIPSSLVSTYSLLLEDVLEVLADTIIVHEAAASRIERITKGFWNNQNVGTSIDELEEYYDFERPVGSRQSRRSRRSSGSRKISPKTRDQETEDDWDLPMDYL